MPADSIPAAHSARTETSAHPVSKSSFERKTTRSHAHPKELHIGHDVAQTIRSKPMAPMSGLGQTRKSAVVIVTSGLPPKAELKSDIAACPIGAKTGSRQPYCMSTRRPSDLCGLHTKKAEVLSISQKAATVPIA